MPSSGFVKSEYIDQHNHLSIYVIDIKEMSKELKNELLNKHQIFITTHSVNVITEVSANNIVILRNNNGDLNAINVIDDLQSIVRAFPEALFSKKLIVCEGNTEYGICNALDEILFQKQNIPMFLYGCIPIKVGGVQIYLNIAKN